MTTVDPNYLETILSDLDNLAPTLAAAYVDAKEAADRANDVLNEAAEAFRWLGVDSVVLDNGTRVALERRDRTTYDYDQLKKSLPKSLLKKITKRSIISSKVKEAVGLGLIDERTATNAATVTPVEQIRIYSA